MRLHHQRRARDGDHRDLGAGRQVGALDPPLAVIDADPRQAVDAEILAPVLMKQVNEKERVCLTLAYAAGMSHPEIGEVTGMPLGNVKSHITQLIKKARMAYAIKSST